MTETTTAGGPVRESLTDLAARFVLLPGVLAEALDEHGGDTLAWAWFDGRRLTRLEVDSAPQAPADRGWHRGDWMQTYTGRRFYPLSPDPADVDPVDIAHALSMLCRYNGHVDRFYSVAEHCILMSSVMPTPALQLEALLHDGSEAYVGDMVRPLKHSGAMSTYIRAEDDVMVAIARRFGMPLKEIPDDTPLPFGGHATRLVHPKSLEVQDADTRILLTERTALMSHYQPSDRWFVDGMEPLPVTIQAWSPAQAEDEWLHRLHQLTTTEGTKA